MSRKRHLARAMVALMIAGLALVAPAAAGEAPRPTGDAAAAAPRSTRHPRANTLFKRRWGVELLGVRRASAGYMLELRYRVLDAKKAQPLFLRGAKPLLIDEATGARSFVPAPATVGPLRSSNPPREGSIYWIFFANPGKRIHSCDLVTVVIGDLRAEGLVVDDTGQPGCL